MKAFLIALVLFVIVFTPLPGSHTNANITSAILNNAFLSFERWEEPVCGQTMEKTSIFPSLSYVNDGTYIKAEVGVIQGLQSNNPYYKRQRAIASIETSSTLYNDDKSEIVIVALLDTGIDSDHEALDGSILNTMNFGPSPTAEDKNGHGTHIAGIIAANNENRTGITGIAPMAKLLNVKVTDDRGRCQLPDLIEGIIWAVDQGASVINISIDFRENTPDLKRAIDYAWCEGALVVAAASNMVTCTPTYPAAYQKSIAVVSMRPDDSVGPLTGYGNWVDIAAPGYNILSLSPGNQYGYKSGTSFAAAHISGLAAVLFSVLDDTNDDGKLNDEVRDAIESGSPLVDDKQYRLIN